MDAICRICLFPTSEFGGTHLIAPCDCSGSMKYVHLECILRWQYYTENMKDISNCELCTALYTLPTKWPLEDEPNPGNDGRWYLLQRSYIWVILSYYIQFLYISLYQKYYGSIIIIQPNINYGTDINEIIETERMTIIYDYNYVYVGICVIITTMYAMEYYKYVYQLRNRLLYITYWFSKLKNVRVYWQPNHLLLLSFISFILLPINMLYGITYIYSLPRLFETHCAILYQMNLDAQFRAPL